VSALVLCAANAAWAQTAPAVSAAVEEIVVTGSRVSRVGFQAPPPVTAVSAEQLRLANPGSISDALRQLPSLSASTGPRGSNGSVGAGGAFLNLRRLGAPRTLTLLDGRRFVPSGSNSTIDTALFPQNLISSVEVVTGGASAAYGSDAVAGVVNFILDKDYTGFKGEVMGGISSRNDNGEGKISLAYGADFAERGHLLLSVEAYKSAGVDDIQDRPNYRRSCEVVLNPGGTTARTFACDVRSSIANFAGLISAVSSSAAAPGTSTTTCRVSSRRTTDRRNTSTRSDPTARRSPRRP
jgi:outer membrane receptor protein involved in Fe transport